MELQYSCRRRLQILKNTKGGRLDVWTLGRPVVATCGHLNARCPYIRKTKRGWGGLPTTFSPQLAQLRVLEGSMARGMHFL